jgi:ribosomal-protein-alanine N-acetyltransferase
MNFQQHANKIMKVKMMSTSDAELISEFYTTNSYHLRPWEPEREGSYHSVDAWSKRLKEREKEKLKGLAVYFGSYSDTKKEIVATCSLTNIVRGHFQACYMGYAVSVAYEGKGVMTALCEHAINYAFNELNLNRIMANYMLHNDRSETLLKRLGFTKEGIAKKYLKINGRWEDHVLTSLINSTNI